MDIDLNRKLAKVTEESERSVLPADTAERAVRAARDIGIRLTQEIKDFDGVFWVSRLKWDYLIDEQRHKPSIRMGGKGPSLEQCLASGSMEFIERWTRHRNNTFDKEFYTCLDLKENKEYRMRPTLELENAKCMASGNNYEEAVLHCLHELIETRTPPTVYWKPCRVVDMDEMFPEMPKWVKDSILLIQSQGDKKEFYKFTAVQYPFNREFDDYRPFTVKKEANYVSLLPNVRNPKYHSPNSGGAAGLNPKKTAFRAMNEIFQFQNEVEDFSTGRKKPLPDYISTAGRGDLPDYETDSITDDIKKILELLGEDVFVGVVDLTDPEIGIPVVKVISDYEPRRSFASRDELSEFFVF